MRLWNGSVVATGFRFDEAQLSRAELLTRLRGLWTSGARLYEDRGRWWLVDLPPRRVDARRAPGAPLVSRHGRFLMAPLSDAQLEVVPVDAVVELHGGLVQAFALSSLTPRHPVELLNLATPEVVQTRAPATAPMRVVRPPPPPTVDEVLPILGPAVPRAPRSLWQTLRAWWAGRPRRQSTGRLLGALRDWWDRRAALAPAEAPEEAALVPAAPPGPGLLASLRRWWDERRAASLTPEHRKAWLEDLKRRFESDDLQEALRRAMPLTDKPGAPAPMTRLPARREALELLANRPAGGAAVSLARDEFHEMRALYRKTAERLVAEGRVDEAAYLLAKLLDDGAAAVALLEKHGRFELAAKLATAQRLPPVERVRLWLQAGDVDAAVRVAFMHQVFAEAIAALSTRAPAASRTLRAAWGQHLAQHQQFAAALVATAPLADAPQDWAQWHRQALETGGADAATALAVDVRRYPEHTPAAQTALAALLADEDTPVGRVVASALLEHAPRADGALYRPVWRRLMAEAARGVVIDGRLASQVLTAAADPALSTDAVPPVANVLGHRLERVPPPVTTRPRLLDVAALPRFRHVRAEGASGLRVLSRDGQPLRHHLVKADALVAGPVGAQVLVLSLDGMLTRVWKLHPETFALVPWFQAPLAAWSPRFDGLMWPVGMEGALVFLDPAAPAPMEWDRVTGLAVERLDLAGGVVSGSGTGPHGNPTCFVAAPGRGSIEPLEPESRIVGPWRYAVRSDEGRWQLELGRRSAHSSSRHQLSPGPWWTLGTERGVVAWRHTEAGTELNFVRWTGAVLSLASFEAVFELQVRELAPGLLGCCDEFGRLLELPLPE